jgi:hypothetical protein
MQPPQNPAAAGGVTGELNYADKLRNAADAVRGQVDAGLGQDSVEHRSGNRGPPRTARREDDPAIPASIS